MKTISISVNRTYDPKEVRPEWLKKSPKAQFGKTDVPYQVPENLDEAIQAEGGKDAVYQMYMKQKRLDCQNDLASKIEAKVLDPEKTKRRTIQSVEVDL